VGVLVVLALAGGIGYLALRPTVGGGPDPTPTANPPLTTTATASSAPTPPSTTASVPPTGDVQVATDATGFSSPSGNIACYLQPNAVRCDIAQATWDPTTVPDRPASCEGVWGDSLEITGTGRAEFVCHGDTVFGTGPVLDYGRALRVGDVTCTSRQTGVECRVGASDHGFSMSRTAYQFF